MAPHGLSTRGLPQTYTDSLRVEYRVFENIPASALLKHYTCTVSRLRTMAKEGQIPKSGTRQDVKTIV